MIPILYLVNSPEDKKISVINEWKLTNEINFDNHADLLILGDQEEGRTSIGVDDVRALIKESMKKPISAKQKLVVMINADHLTIEAQNSLLKTLEEPPDDVNMILIANSSENFLSTILSRVIVNDERSLKQSINLDDEFASDFESLLQLEDCARLLKSPIIGKDRKGAKEWLTQSLSLVHRSLLSSSSDGRFRLSKNAQILLQGLKYIEANMHVQLTIDWVLMNLEN